MSFEIKKDFRNNCSRYHETCEIAESLFADDEFYIVAGTLDTDEAVRREAFECRRVIAGLLDLCVEGDCPGQKPEVFDDLARRRREA